MAEEKKMKKPRTAKKAGAGTPLPVETATDVGLQFETAQFIDGTETKVAKKPVKAKKTTVKTEEKAEVQAQEKPKKTKAKKPAEEKPKEEPAKEKAKEEPAEKKPKAKKTATKKTEEKAEAPKQEEPKQELKKEEAKQEQPKAVQPEEKPAKVEEKPVQAEEKAVKTEDKPVQAEEKTVKTEEKPVKAEEKRPVTRAEKQAERTAKFKPFLAEALAKNGSCKRSALVQQAAEAYTAAYGVAEFGNDAGVRGMVGNVLDLMIEGGEAFVEGKTVYAEKPTEAMEKRESENTRKEQKEPPVSVMNEEKTAEKKQEKTVETVKETADLKPEEKGKTEQKEDVKTVAEKAEESANVQTALTKVDAPAPAPVYDLSALFESRKQTSKKTEEKPAESQQTVKAIEEEKAEEIGKTKPVKPQSVQPMVETILSAGKQNEQKAVSVKTEKAEKREEKPALKPAPKMEEKSALKPALKTEEKPQEKAQVKIQEAKVQPQAKSQAQSAQAVQSKREVPTRRPNRQDKTDPMEEAFLKKLRALGGNYFEYYAIYLLERYSRMNGRRLEGMRISGGEYDGGIDGELELTDRLGFRETIYVQAKNWEPTDERWWIGETILQQFIGAVAYRQAKEGKQHCRGMFITTSAFTNGAKEMLSKMSDKFVGYDGDDLYETAKECQFGMIQDEKGSWKIDEELLSGNKSFFFML